MYPMCMPLNVGLLYVHRSVCISPLCSLYVSVCTSLRVNVAPCVYTVCMSFVCILLCVCRSVYMPHVYVVSLRVYASCVCPLFVCPLAQWVMRCPVGNEMPGGMKCAVDDEMSGRITCPVGDEMPGG